MESVNKNTTWPMTWEEIDSHVDYMWANIERTYSDVKDIKTIVAVAKGGLIPAALVWQKIPHATLVILRVQSCDTFLGQQPAKILNPEVLVHQIPNDVSTIVIDDICDSGNTFRLIAQSLDDVSFACMLARANPADQFEYDFCGGTVSDGIWVDFPWEHRLVEEPVEMPF